MNKHVQEFHDYVLGDVMGDIPGITSRRMFGGYGLYKDGAIFAIITSGSELYFKVDERLKEKFRSYDSHPFVYSGYRDGRPVEMPYWSLPEEIMEDRERIAEWINNSARASKRPKER